MYLLFYLHLTESLYQLTTQNKVLTITTLHQSSDNPEAGGAVELFSARVVERHASACLRTVGVD